MTVTVLTGDVRDVLPTLAAGSVQCCVMARNRVTRDCPLFSSWPPAEDPADARLAHDMAGDEYQRPSHGTQPDLFAEAAE